MVAMPCRVVFATVVVFQQCLLLSGGGNFLTPLCDDGCWDPGDPGSGGSSGGGAPLEVGGSGDSGDADASLDIFPSPTLVAPVISLSVLSTTTAAAAVNGTTPLLSPTLRPSPTNPIGTARLTLTFESALLDPSNDTQLEILVEQIESEVVQYLEEEFGIDQSRVISVTVEVIPASQRRSSQRRETAETQTILVHIELEDLQATEQRALQTQVDSGNFTITVEGNPLTATALTVQYISRSSSSPPPGTTLPTIPPTLVRGTDYHLAFFFWVTVGAAGVCVCLVTLCATAVLCGICCYHRRRKRKRRATFYLEGFPFAEHPVWKDAYLELQLPPSGSPQLRPVAYIISNPMTESTLNFVHEL